MEERVEKRDGRASWGMVLAAGIGSRLCPLTDDLPKPLVPICNQPAISHVFSRLRAAGVHDAVVNSWHLGARLEAAVGEGPSGGPRVTFSREESLLGTGGGLKLAAPYLAGDDPFILVNGDVVSSVELGEALAFHKKMGAALTLVVVRRRDLPSALHKIAWDEDGWVQEIDGVFRPETSLNESARGIYAGALIGTTTLLDVLPDGREACLKEEGFWPLLQRDVRVAAFLTDAYWSDVGTPERYARTHFEILEGNEKVLSTFLPSDVVAHSEGVWIHPSAEIADSAQCLAPCLIGARAVIGENAIVGPYAVIGNGAGIASGSHVRGSIVWDEVKVDGEKEDCICRHEGDTCWLSP